MLARWDLLAFDLYGTLLDVDGLAARLRALGGEEAAAALPAWRRAQLERSWALNARAEYQPFDEVTAAALAEVAPALSATLRAEMAAAFQGLPAFADAAATLAALAGAGVRRAVLSNGTLPMVRAALTAASLAVDEVRSADEVRVYKPDPRVYALLDGLAPRARTLFVSANGWDAEGAKRAGLAVAWIDRGGAPPGLAPDFRVASLAELVALASAAPAGVAADVGGRIYQLMVLTAWSDGELHETEQASATRLLAEVPELRALSGNVELARAARALLADRGVRGAVDAIAEGLEGPASQQLALRCCARVLAADGRLDRQEFAVISQLRRRFGLTVAEVDQVLAAATR